MSDLNVLTVVEEKTELLPLYRVLLHNDNVNDMDEVVTALQKTFAFEAIKAVSVMMEAHSSGVSLCVVESHEDAEFHAFMMKVCGLSSSIEPE